jgi:putative ABC transport system substrate-binding protein
MRRRDFIAGLAGSTAAWPITAHGQQRTMPVIGYLSSLSLDYPQLVAAFHEGLKESGFIEGQNVAIEFRFAEGRYERLAVLAEDLVRRPVDVFVATGGSSSAVAAKPLVPSTMPLVFAMGGDPVKLGIVASLARPGGHATGVYFLVNGLASKQVQLLHELLPKAKAIGFLVNPNDPNTETDVKDVQTAADALGQKVVVAKASNEADLNLALTTLVQQKIDALFVNVDPFLSQQRARISAFATSHKLPASGASRTFAVAGGLMSYGTSIPAANRQLGHYVARVLKGTKPADLPVEQSTRFEFVLNLKTAKALGLDVPTSILLRADELIECA